MLSQLLLQIEFSLGVNAFSILLCVVGLSVAFLSGRYLLRRPAAPQSAALPRALDPAAQGSTVIRRRVVPVQVTDADGTVEPLPGYVIDRNTEGLTLELEEEGQLEAGTQVKVRPAEADVTVPWVLIEVQKCRKLRSSWRLKCKYVRVPPYTVRMLFG